MQYAERQLFSDLYRKTGLSLSLSVHTEFISVWTVFYMKTALKRVVLCFVIVCVLWSVGSIRNRTAEDAAAACVSADEKQIKQVVRLDDIKERIIQDTKDILDLSAAKEYVTGRLPAVRRIIADALSESSEICSAVRDDGTEKKIR